MNIAILGATSQIAKDLIISFSEHTDYDCTLFSRSAIKVQSWLDLVVGKYSSNDYTSFPNSNYDVIINFVGVGDPFRAKEMGEGIFEITHQYDQLVLDYVKLHPSCKYIFLSSGAVFGDVFDEPVKESSVATVPINHLNPINWYAISKLYAEARHRSLENLSIIDVRVFNYFSHTQDMSARFLITDIARAIRDKTLLKTSPENIVRDFLHPVDFYQLIECILNVGNINAAVDCYSKEPIDKISLLDVMQKEFSLQYKLIGEHESVNATGGKSNYYSLNRGAENLGYKPNYSAIECILTECNLLIQNQL